uniref:Uncharacterized protein n=1 Tax=Arundo donax TaxID=35708 RepID=A0A0A8ZC67_ARUDO
MIVIKGGVLNQTEGITFDRLEKTSPVYDKIT